MPDSKVYLGRVPFDSSYRHTIWFGSREDQTTQMLAHMTSAFSDDDYTFIREGAFIRVPVNADSLNGYNYCMYNNGNKWYYNFITQIEYLNENTTAIHLERDVFQTWMFDYDKTACFVEREHVADDSRYAHTVPEPDMPLEYTYNGTTNHNYSPDYVIVETTEYPHYLTATTEAISADAVTGGKYHGIYSAAMFLVFNMVQNADGAMLEQFMTSMNAAGAAEGIVHIFAVDSSIFSEGDIIPLDYDGIGATPPSMERMKMMARNTAPNENTIYQAPPTTLDSYKPRNNKLFSYPFTYCEIGDYTGKTVDLMFELSREDNHAIRLREEVPVSTSLTGVIRPINYDGHVGSPYSDVFTVDLSMTLPWTYDVFANWSAQNMVSNSLSVLGSIFSLGLTAASPATGASEAVRALGAGQAITGAAGSLGGIATMAMQPNKVMGNSDGGVKAATQTWGWFTRVRCPRAEYARIWDDFFDMFGYEVDRIKVPAFASRPSWNYVKTSNCPYNGNVNADDMARIQNIYNSGVTLWHTWDVGNYSLANGA